MSPRCDMENEISQALGQAHLGTMLIGEPGLLLGLDVNHRQFVYYVITLSLTSRKSSRIWLSLKLLIME